jgi:hypothetical protein
MAMVIHKFPASDTDRHVQVADGSVVKILSAGTDANGEMSVWALIDTEGEPDTIFIASVFTGVHDASDLLTEGFEFIDTVAIVRAGLVFHVFAKVGA